MRTVLTAALLVVLGTSPLAAQMGFLPGSQPIPGVGPPKITVNGEAVVLAKPDKIILSFGIETHDAKVGLARQKNADIWKKAAAVLKECGVPDKDVQTDYLSIRPPHEGYERTEEPTAFLAHNMFVVTLADPKQVETLVSKLLECGVNHVNGVEFQTTQFKQHRESARGLALAAAREKAVKMTAALGCAVGKPIDITETDDGGSWYFSSWCGWGGLDWWEPSGMSQTVSQAPDLAVAPAVAGGAPQSMALGKLSIRARVSVTFELKDDTAGKPAR